MELLGKHSAVAYIGIQTDTGLSTCTLAKYKMVSWMPTNQTAHLKDSTFSSILKHHPVVLILSRFREECLSNSCSSSTYGVSALHCKPRTRSFHVRAWASTEHSEPGFILLHPRIRAMLACSCCTMQTCWLESSAWPVSALQNNRVWTSVTMGLCLPRPRAGSQNLGLRLTWVRLILWVDTSGA